MREKYESLSLATLKDLAKARGLKGVSTLRKPELIERMLQEDQLENEENNKQAENKEPDKKAEEEEHKKAENESSQSHVSAENVQLDSGEKANGILARGLHLGKGIQDNGYGQFLSMLGYKLEERGKYLIKVDRYFASSKICSVCGHKKKELALSERIYLCECGNRMDRDVNAAVNILKEGKRIYKKCA